jgi:hypothetical protein
MQLSKRRITAKGNIMGIEEDRIKKELLAKEEQLLENAVRNDAAKIADLIDGSCLFYTASGKPQTYRPGEIFVNLDGVLYIDSNSVRYVDLSENCKLLVYIAAKVNKNTRTKSNHSSIWKKNDGKWKMVFHQMTNCSD